MENKYKEYGSIIVITLLHGIYTYEFLGGMPYIAVGIVSKITVGAFLMWLIYGLIIYLITQKWIIQTNITIKHCVIALGFGVGTAVIKAGVDFGIEKLINSLKGFITMAYIDEATTFIFFMLLTYILLVFVAKKKIHFDIKKVKVPLTVLVGIVLSYVGLVVHYVHQNQTAIIEYDATEEQIFNLDYYFGMKILDMNVWFYVVFYITFWWFMRRMTEKTEEKQGDSL